MMVRSHTPNKSRMVTGGGAHVVFDKCPACGNEAITHIRRVSGYLDVRDFFTNGKKAEEKHRTDDHLSPIHPFISPLPARASPSLSELLRITRSNSTDSFIQIAILIPSTFLFLFFLQFFTLSTALLYRLYVS